MSLARYCRHLFQTRWGLRRRFPPSLLSRVEGAVQAAERHHAGEIRIALEGDLDLYDLLTGKTPRQRAVEVFAQLGVWDTAHNNGVLIYVLLADRDVEIVSDRGFNGRVQPAEWEAVCRAMESEFARGRWEPGLLAGIEAVSRLMVTHFPAQGGSDRNELPDRPRLL